MTAEHCAYCDGHPIDSVGAEAVDHFRPKSHPAFYELVCTWTNLFLTCTTCNHAKAEIWDDALLQPDDLDFSFDRYFEYRFDNGTLQPASAATAEEQRRAVRTIEILQLNRPGACASRRRAVQWMRSAIAGDDVGSLPYRYLLPLSQPT